MSKLRVLLFTMFLTLFFIQNAEAAPSKLKAIPMSGTQVDLTWISSANEQYDIWQTVDGITWNKIRSSLSAGTSTSSITSGIEPYKNYYFVVTVSNSVYTYPADYIEGQNASNEAVAYPPNKHAHLYFPASPDSCKNCHTAHTALGPKLLATATISDACISCHDGTQSKYKVLDGMAQNPSGVFNVDTSSGPFGSILGATATSDTTTNHSVGTAVYHAPGGNPVGSTQDWTEPLGCGSCHDAHDSTSYRMITKKAPDNTNISVKAYAYSDLTPGQEKEKVTYIHGISGLCMGCHKDYYALEGSGSSPATGTYQNDGKYRHAVGVDPASYSKGALTTDLPLEGKVDVGSPKVITCITCHNAHGSNSATNDSKDYGDGTGPKATNWLLKLDYRGTCENCHKK